MGTPQEKAQSVAWFIESKSDTRVQRKFRTKFKRVPSSRRSIREWHTNFLTTGSVLHKKEVGRPRTNDENVEWLREAFLHSSKKSIRSIARQLQKDTSQIICR
ncbi:DUF4817 domain-containing protein [Nephila pilipes]|uniref:DUF4817 domain-containing protein n=1 Tax=Nephila pilipes TaxID=299642 RepID=A0A8X6Q0W2_NEPPI|nr:DUF4817 domain-containing protein [Nephila pilipes]